MTIKPFTWKPSPPCCVCGSLPTLRQVGKRFFCKDHIAEAIKANAGHENDSRATGRPQFELQEAA